MTPAEREQVVDLLRAAADYAMRVPFDSGSAVSEVSIWYWDETYTRSPIGVLALDAERYIPGHVRPWSLLEAARRVEEGWDVDG